MKRKKNIFLVLISSLIIVLVSIYYLGDEIAKITIDNNTIHYKGIINEKSYEELLSQVDKYPHTIFKKVIINSTGGDTVYGRRIAEFILKNKLDVEIEEICFSSCANYIFLAGKTKYIQKNAFVGWHGSEHQIYVLKEENKTLEQYMKKMIKIFLLEDGSVDKITDSFINDEYDKLMKSLAEEKDFFKKINIDISITLSGMLFFKSKEKYKNYAGWTYSISDMKKFGIKNIIYLGKEEEYPLMKKEYKKMIYLHKYNKQYIDEINTLIK